MNCPRCNAATLVQLDRAGIEIDRCVRCRGIWLDRGELDKLIAHSLHDERGDERDDASDDDARDLVRDRRTRGASDDDPATFWAALFD
ncbi:MAG: zf-TFIIB domain-containing protein [Kofleriaceae bacterium]